MIKPKPKIILMKIILETRNSWLCFRLASGQCDVLLIKYQTWGTGTKTALTLVQVLHRLSTIPSGKSSYFTRHEVSSVFTISFCTQCQ